MSNCQCNISLCSTHQRGARLNRIASLGAELVTIREKIGSFVSRKKKDVESEKIAIQSQNRLVEIENELSQLGAFMDELGFIYSFPRNKFTQPIGEMSFIDWAKRLIGS